MLDKVESCYHHTVRAYSLDLRQRVLAAVDAGMPRAAVLRTFQISRGTLQRWLKRRSDGLPLAGGTGPGRPPAMRGPALVELRAQRIATPMPHWRRTPRVGIQPTPTLVVRLWPALSSASSGRQKQSLCDSAQDPVARAARRAHRVASGCSATSHAPPHPPRP